MLQHPRRRLTVKSGNQLQQSHPVIQPVIKNRLFSMFGGNIADQAAVLHHTKQRVVDAGKGLKALAASLSGPGTQNDLAIEHHHHTRHVRGGYGEGIPQVLLTVCRLKSDWLLCPGEHDWLWAALHQIT